MLEALLDPSSVGTAEDMLSFLKRDSEAVPWVVVV